MNWELDMRLTRADLKELKSSIDIMSSTVNAVLVALQQADSDLAAAVAPPTTGATAASAEVKKA